jgi:pyrimidine operon attenuation protein/uracil phosphoribosyltransferase
MEHKSFDTYGLIKRLIAAGITEEQAELLVFSMKDVIDYEIEILSSQIDVRLLRDDIELSKSNNQTLCGWILIIQAIMAICVFSAVIHYEWFK